MSYSGKRVSSCLNGKKMLITLTSLPLATPTMMIRNITVLVVPIPHPADNSLVYPQGICNLPLSYTSFQHTYASLKLKIGELVPWMPVKCLRMNISTIPIQRSQCKKFISNFVLMHLNFMGCVIPVFLTLTQ